MSFLKKYVFLMMPFLFLGISFLGASINRTVIEANDGWMPVQSEYFYRYSTTWLYYRDARMDKYSKGISRRPDTKVEFRYKTGPPRLAFLADILPGGYSFGDYLILSGLGMSFLSFILLYMRFVTSLFGYFLKN